jgi:hypothetical protein
MRIPILLLVLASTGLADFSFTTTLQTSISGPGVVSRHLIKGHKMKIASGSTITISDLDSGTTTTIDTAAKTYRVSAKVLSKPGVDALAAVKDTGEQRRIRGLDCRQIVVSMTRTGQARPMYVENDVWLSIDVPGAAEWKAMQLKLAEKGMLSDLQTKVAKLNGIPVRQITRMKPVEDEEVRRAKAAKLAKRALEEASKKSDVWESEAVRLAVLAQGKPDDYKFLVEILTESSAFSTDTIPASEFVIPAGFKKAIR